MPLDEPRASGIDKGATVEAPVARRSRQMNLKKPQARGLGYVQPEMLQAGMWAATHAPEFSDREELTRYLKQQLPYNSLETRNRYAWSVQRWSYSEEGCFSLPRAVWQAYDDEPLLARILNAVWTLRVAPLRRLVTDELAHMDVGTPLPWEQVQGFIERNAVGGSMKDNQKRIPVWLERLGFIHRERDRSEPGATGRRTMIVAQPYFDMTAFLILFHAELAPTPRTVTVADILAHPFWRCLGGRDPRQVRDALSLAASVGAIDRYTRVDQLEQATTRFALEELLARKVRV